MISLPVPNVPRQGRSQTVFSADIEMSTIGAQGGSWDLVLPPCSYLVLDSQTSAPVLASCYPSGLGQPFRIILQPFRVRSLVVENPIERITLTNLTYGSPAPENGVRGVNYLPLDDGFININGSDGSISIIDSETVETGTRVYGAWKGTVPAGSALNALDPSRMVLPLTLINGFDVWNLDPTNSILVGYYKVNVAGFATTGGGLDINNYKVTLPAMGYWSPDCEIPTSPPLPVFYFDNTAGAAGVSVQLIARGR